MNLKQFRYVLVLSEEGSFSRAAEKLNISQPSLSQYIKNIEKQLGVTLFERLSGEVRLTDAGRVYIDAGEKILDLERQMENRFSDIAEFRGGTVTVGISPYRSIHMMPDVLRRFNEKYPGVKLIILEKSGHELIDDARSGKFDLCVIALPLEDEAFESVLIRREEVLLAVPEDSDFCRELENAAVPTEGRRYPAVDISLAEGHSFAMLSEFMPMRNVTDRILEKYGVSLYEKVEVSSNEALLSIVRSGVCSSFVPSGLTDGGHCNDEGTRFFSLLQDTVFRDIGIIYRKGQYLSEPMRELIKIFKKLP